MRAVARGAAAKGGQGRDNRTAQGGDDALDPPWVVRSLGARFVSGTARRDPDQWGPRKLPLKRVFMDTVVILFIPNPTNVFNQEIHRVVHECHPFCRNNFDNYIERCMKGSVDSGCTGSFEDTLFGG